ncbi:hypothetical protein BC938DRAFT_472438 [Jimgerdemannia flammicorona]|uniref:Uncharacterized protein n=1 Tax=Jimgerdemannia flammicorona TaxID=994334 RepID=A0A433Q631_9FUNG|nr:hypothetical protein BC938DRAFT_472438 [Jimgerdemannia flammicorona]
MLIGGLVHFRMQEIKVLNDLEVLSGDLQQFGRDAFSSERIFNNFDRRRRFVRVDLSTSPLRSWHLTTKF